MEGEVATRAMIVLGFSAVVLVAANPFLADKRLRSAAFGVAALAALLWIFMPVLR